MRNSSANVFARLWRGSASYWLALIVVPAFLNAGYYLFDKRSSDSLKFMPWADAIANVVNGMMVANGGIIYRTFAENHMPGAIVWLTPFLGLTGAAGEPPSIQALAHLFIVAVFATSLFAHLCLYLAVRFLRLSNWLYVALTAVAMPFLFRSYDFAAPMTESMIVFLAFFVPILLHTGLLAERLDQRAEALMLLALPLNTVMLFIGLTIFPANLLLGAAAGVLVIAAAAESAMPLGALLGSRRLWIACGAVGVVLLLSLSRIDIAGLFFWNITYNRALLPDIPSNIRHYIVDGLWFDGGAALPFLARFHVVAVLLIVVAPLLARRPRGDPAIGRYVAFASLMLGATALCAWRVSDGYKAAMPLGFSCGLLLLAAARLRPVSSLSSRWLRRNDGWMKPAALAATAVAVIILSMPPPGSVRGNYTHLEARPTYYDWAGVCRRGQAAGCRCLEMTIFRPYLLALHDVSQCPHRYFGFTKLLLNQPATRQQLMKDARDPSIAFQINLDPALVQPGVPAEFLSIIEREHRCLTIGSYERLCYFDPGRGSSDTSSSRASTPPL
jgi:hypothetical protein